MDTIVEQNNFLTISVIIPVGNGYPYLTDVFQALNIQSRRPDELIIVNDRVRDGSLDCLDLLDMEYRVIGTNTENGRYGVSAARNIGAENSSSAILVFLDSDVILPDLYLERLYEQFRLPRHPEEHIDGIVGISGEECIFRNFLSNYKNLWMRYTYLRLKGFIGTVNTSCFAMRREAFLGSGGFDESFRRPGIKSWRLPGIEDFIFGDRLRDKGYNNIVVKELYYIHKKKYNLRSAIRVDYIRSKELTEYYIRLILRGGKKPKNSIPGNYYLGIPLFYLALVLLPLGYFNRYIFFISLFLFIISSVLGMNFLLYVKKIKGLRFSFKAFFYQFIMYASSGIGIALGILSAIFPERSEK